MFKIKNENNIPQKPLPPAWRAAFERLDAALRENTECKNARKIALWRKVAFADVEELEASGRLIIPS